MMIWFAVTVAFAWMTFTTYMLARIERHVLKKQAETPSMFTEQLNRRLIEEHTKELKRYNERKQT